jgi:hypothetical protein
MSLYDMVEVECAGLDISSGETVMPGEAAPAGSSRPRPGAPNQAHASTRS